MSIYRRRDQSEYDATDIRKLHEIQARSATASDPDAVRWAAARRAQPADTLLPGTQRWIDDLPISARPFALIKAYPRIANRIAACWAMPDEFNACMDDLLVDHRGSRQGFPALIQRELVALRSHYGLTVIDFARPAADNWR